jgi:glycosyltransferase involved in cell wall biosynthesis
VALATVLHVIDSLAIGGAERAAVNFANALPQKQYTSHLCVTRARGPLVKEIESHVKVLYLDRQARLDISAIVRLYIYLVTQDIQIIHAHSSSLILSSLVALLRPQVKLIWHAHFGQLAFEQRPAIPFALATKRAQGIICVTNDLANWARKSLGFRSSRVWYIPNFVQPISAKPAMLTDLPGIPGKRIVCIANLRPEKDHLTLVRSMKSIVKDSPGAHLFIVGAYTDRQYAQSIENLIHELNLATSVTLTGSQPAYDYLVSCDVGVLSSESEGLPLTLLEYGTAGLGVVATAVGQCPDVLDYGRCGLLVPPKSPEKLADAILHLLSSPGSRTNYGQNLRQRVAELYSRDVVITRVCHVYDTVLGGMA